VYDKFLKLFWRNISGERAKRLCAEIYMSDVKQTHSAFWNTAKMVADELKDSGVEDVRIIEQKADGTTKYGDWIVPQAWEVEKAYISIVEPQEVSGVIVSYEENPVSIATLSAATPNGGITAELVSWEDIKNKEEVSGKVVLTAKRMREIRDEAFKYGALGIISYWLPGDRRFIVPDANYWENYCFVPKNVWNGFGFTISPRKGEMLRGLLQRGKVKVHVEIKAKFLDATVPIVTGVIYGSEEVDREVVLVAHLYEVGANDNASGCATCIEIMRTINELINRGELPRPRRSIRVILGYECYALMAYLTMIRDRIGKMIAGLDLDMVGENQDLCRSVLLLSTTHPAARAFSDYLMMDLLEMARNFMPRFVWKIRETGIYMIHDGSILSDPMINVPAPALINWPDIFYHSNLDTPDKVSPDMLRLVGAIGATYAYFIANASTGETKLLAYNIFNIARKRIMDITNEYLKELFRGKRIEEVVNKAMERIDFITEVEERALRSVLRICSDGEVRSEVDKLCKELKDFAKHEKERIIHLAEKEIGRPIVLKAIKIEVPKGLEEVKYLVPIRKVLGVPTLADASEDMLRELMKITRERYPYSRMLCAPLFWANGKRSILEIADNIRREIGRCDLEFLLKLFRFLEKYGYVELKDLRVKS